MKTGLFVILAALLATTPALYAPPIARPMPHPVEPYRPPLRLPEIKTYDSTKPFEMPIVPSTKRGLGEIKTYDPTDPFDSLHLPRRDQLGTETEPDVNEFLKKHPALAPSLKSMSPAEQREFIKLWQRVGTRIAEPKTKLRNPRWDILSAEESLQAAAREQAAERRRENGRHLIFDEPNPEKTGFTHIPEGYTGTVLVENMDYLKAARKAVHEAKAPRALVAIKRSSDPQKNLEILGEKPSHLTVIHDFPEDSAAVRAIHRQEATKSQLAEVTAARQEIETVVAMASERVKPIDLARVRSATNLADTVRGILEKSGKDTLSVLVGHIEDGRLRFHDGSELPLSEIPKNGQIWVLGCRTVWHKQDGDGLDLATGRAIRYTDAAAATAAIVRDFEQGADYRTMALSLQNLEPAPTAAPTAALAPAVATPAKAKKPNSKPARPPSPEERTVPAGFAVMLAANDNVLVFQPYNEATA